MQLLGDESMFVIFATASIIMFVIFATASIIMVPRQMLTSRRGFPFADRVQKPFQTIWCLNDFYLGIEFHFFIFHSVMKDRGSRC